MQDFKWRTVERISGRGGVRGDSIKDDGVTRGMKNVRVALIDSPTRNFISGKT